MVTRAMRGAHLALRGVSFGEGTPLGDTTTPLLTRDVLFMRVEWATTELSFPLLAITTTHKRRMSASKASGGRLGRTDFDVIPMVWEGVVQCGSHAASTARTR